MVEGWENEVPLSSGLPGKFEKPSKNPQNTLPATLHQNVPTTLPKRSQNPQISGQPSAAHLFGGIGPFGERVGSVLGGGWPGGFFERFGSVFQVSLVSQSLAGPGHHGPGRLL